MAKSVLSEINRQLKASIREAERRQRARQRELVAAERAAERARAEEKRAATLYLKAQEKERKAAEKLAKQLHVERMAAEVDSLNAELKAEEEDLAELLTATLDVDDFVDLEQLRRKHVPKPFEPGGLAVPGKRPALPPLPERPHMIEVEAPGVLSKALGGGRRFQKRLKAAELENRKALRVWEKSVEAISELRAKVQAEYEASEADRFARLEELELQHGRRQEALRMEVEQHNQALDTLIADLGYGEPHAVAEYVEIVLGNSVYPSCFPVESTGEFHGAEGELEIKTLVPEPSTLSDVKAYRYNKAKDEIVSSSLSAKAQRDRYSEAIWKVALRTLHEVFESDRRGIIRTVSLQVGARAASPATGVVEYIPFVAVGAKRDSFMEIELENVVPLETLKFLGASLSRNPFALVAADVRGIA